MLGEAVSINKSGSALVTLEPGGEGHLQRQRQRLASEAMSAISQHLDLADFGPGDPLKLGDFLQKNPEAFIAALPHLSANAARKDLVKAVKKTKGQGSLSLSQHLAGGSGSQNHRYSAKSLVAPAAQWPLSLGSQFERRRATQRTPWRKLCPQRRTAPSLDSARAGW